MANDLKDRLHRLYEKVGNLREEYDYLSVEHDILGVTLNEIELAMKVLRKAKAN